LRAHSGPALGALFGCALGFTCFARASKPLARKAPVTAFPKGVRAPINP
jgi:hypothetical protein